MNKYVVYIDDTNLLVVDSDTKINAIRKLLDWLELNNPKKIWTTIGIQLVEEEIS